MFRVFVLLNLWKDKSKIQFDNHNCTSPGEGKIFVSDASLIVLKGSSVYFGSIDTNFEGDNWEILTKNFI